MMMESTTCTETKATAGPVASLDRVLIVDDEAGIRELFIAILAHELPKVPLDAASNGAQALECFQQWRHRVLIMDLHMPIMDGLTSFMKIRQYCEDAAVRMPSVIFCTGFAPPASVREIVKGSVHHHFLTKPVKSDVLVNAILARLQ